MSKILELEGLKIENIEELPITYSNERNDYCV